MYSEDMIRIMDDVKPREYGGRIAHKRVWIGDSRLDIWYDCADIDEFKRRANLGSIKAAKDLDKHFASVTGEPAIFKKSQHQINRERWW